MKNKLILIGAGPGSADLITYRGLKRLQKAQVILYDALVDEELLDLANANAIKVFVGKRGGQPSFKQEKINQLIVSYAAVYGEVIRLKGGDPFVFGRGLEEIDFAKKNGLEIEVVPGISSATGLTALQQISLTQRGIADGFWVLTATKQEQKFNKDIALAAQSNTTVVILMGVRKLAEIAEVFKKFGQNNTPVMIIQNGAKEGEKTVISDVEHIVLEAKMKEVKSPAIIVIGNTLKTQIKETAPILTYLN